jgi:hypothetical protein
MTIGWPLSRHSVSVCEGFVMTHRRATRQRGPTGASYLYEDRFTHIVVTSNVVLAVFGSRKAVIILSAS